MRLRMYSDLLLPNPDIRASVGSALSICQVWRTVVDTISLSCNLYRLSITEILFSEMRGQSVPFIRKALWIKFVGGYYPLRCCGNFHTPFSGDSPSVLPSVSCLLWNTYSSSEGGLPFCSKKCFFCFGYTLHNRYNTTHFCGYSQPLFVFYLI